ncbi:MAG: hypothetical protein JWQ37_1142 [Blastococcus sp.]|nr:hypothetical protein [Blastococcus sp.]
MAPPISDAVAVDVLRRVDRLLTPLVNRLGRPPALPQTERDRWWADQVSRVAAGVAAAPRFAGKLADLLPLQNTVGAVVQSVVVPGVAGEHSVSDPAERVSLLDARCGGPPGCSPASTTPSTPAPRATCGTGRSPTSR